MSSSSTAEFRCRARFTRFSMHRIRTKQPSYWTWPSRAGVARIPSWRPGPRRIWPRPLQCSDCRQNTVCADGLERLNKEIKRRTRVAPLFQHRQLPTSVHGQLGRTRRGVDDRKNLLDHETLRPRIHNRPKSHYGNLQTKSCFITITVDERVSGRKSQPFDRIQLDLQRH